MLELNRLIFECLQNRGDTASIIHDSSVHIKEFIHPAHSSDSTPNVIASQSSELGISQPAALPGQTDITNSSIRRKIVRARVIISWSTFSRSHAPLCQRHLYHSCTTILSDRAPIHTGCATRSSNPTSPAAPAWLGWPHLKPAISPLRNSHPFSTTLNYQYNPSRLLSSHNLPNTCQTQCENVKLGFAAILGPKNCFCCQKFDQFQSNV